MAAPVLFHFDLVSPYGYFASGERDFSGRVRLAHRDRRRRAVLGRRPLHEAEEWLARGGW